MAQQIALRVHADRRGRRVVAFHPTCHLELHEDKAYQRLHGLIGRPLGDGRELLSLADLEAVDEPLAALLDRAAATRDRRPAAGLGRPRGAGRVRPRARGGRPPRRRSPLGVRPLLRSSAVRRSPGCSTRVYVSFYKGLGGLSGSMLLGEDDVIAEAREWRRRHGGTLYQLWPYAAAGLAGLRLRLPRMAAYVEHAQAIAAVLAGIEGVQVVPDPPQTPMMHLHLDTTAAQVTAGIRRLATEERLWTWGGSVADRHARRATGGADRRRRHPGDGTGRGGRRGQGPVTGLTAAERLD